jgi:cell division septation protein DedD
MARNDEGDFELVMGNRQLLSGFFIVVILFGVFFTMGYIVGRHSTPAPMSAAVNPEPIPRSDTPGPPPAGQAVLAPVDSKTEETPPAPENPVPVTRTQPATAPPEAPKPTTAPKPAPAPAHTTAGSKISEPVPGSYLQVLAPKRSAADGVVDSLKSKGITAVLAPGPNEDSVRILVGPLDSSSMGKMRADLESAGFKPFAKKY